MTVLLVLCMIVLFLTADYFVQRSRRARVAEQLQPMFAGTTEIPSNIRLAGNHTWIKHDKHGNILIGLDELLGKIVGPIEEIILPAINATVTPATRNIALRHGGKRLEVAVPVSGQVIEVNRHALSQPGVARRDPYGDGWLLKIRPKDGVVNSHATFGGERARQWLEEQRESVKEFFMLHMPQPAFATSQDGGTPVEGLLHQFDAEVWREFQESYATLSDCRRTPEKAETEVKR